MRADDDLADLGALELAARLGEGATTSVAVVEACLARIAAREPQLRAWAFLDPVRALAEARAADERRASGRGTGPLNGIPVGVKDVIATGDMPTEYGSALFKGHQPSADAAVVTALRQAGAVILGKTVTTELAALNPAPTRNPHDPTRTPGGSSSGSAAAVASGMVPVALGTQTAGSVIRPASFCGVHAIKPTHGLISRAGMMLQSHTLDTIGVFARSTQDLAFVVDCLSAEDPRDPSSYPRSQGRLLAVARDMPPVPPRLAFWGTPAWDQVTAATRAAFEALVAAPSNGIEQIELPDAFNAVIGWQATIQAAENAAYYGDFLLQRPDGLSAKLKGRLEPAMDVCARDYLIALNGRSKLIAALDAVFDRYDAIVCPAAPGPAPRDLDTTGNPVFNGLWTYLGLPAVTLPLLTVDGMPVGVQIVGAPRDDGRVLRTARWLEAAQG